MKKQLHLSLFALLFGTLLTFAQTSPVCGGTFTDPEGATANYANNSDYSVTIYPNNPGDFVTVSLPKPIRFLINCSRTSVRLLII